MKKIKIVTVITLFLISLIGCKKSQEELAKELEIQKKQAVINSVDSVYQLGGNGVALLVDRENLRSLHDACFEFLPKKGRGTIKFYKHPKIYQMQIQSINELEYDLVFQEKKAKLILKLEGEFPVKLGSMGTLSAIISLKIEGDSQAYENLGTMDLIYGGESIAKARHGRFNTLEECEAQNAADEELSKSLREQDGACEGPGC
ncbi:putative lipoprotein [Leptospira noguchii serovar Autumnalis str. ZUN142]|uniref:Putative lipoprotein n=1 Tax=Leptospira noguchii serovar Autumnalis str. ZUN142 TaxID=1085540 RepID=M6UJ98_9LEPT|nr:lipoprotein, tandem type [Leptospira noguchii]EMO42886.1 putative lipoprotein [Leptospira noguchii serovar Autumnalis str. ZUN142]